MNYLERIAAEAVKERDDAKAELAATKEKLEGMIELCRSLVEKNSSNEAGIREIQGLAWKVFPAFKAINKAMPDLMKLGAGFEEF